MRISAYCLVLLLAVFVSSAKSEPSTEDYEEVFQDYDARNQDISVDEGHCIWYGREPGDDADKINYAYSGPAKPLNDPDATAVLKNICPDLYKDVQDKDPGFCCSVDQVHDMVFNFELFAAFFGRCPSCVKNLRNIFCFMTCDPHHSKFLRPNRTDVIDGMQFITKLDVYVEEEYAQNLYDSCAEVKNPSSNCRAITTLCGQWGDLCNADRLLNFMGGGPEQGGLSPFDIIFTAVHEGEEPPIGMTAFSTPNVPCNEAISNSSEACSCVDCPRSCPVPKPWPPLPEPWNVGVMDGLSFV